MKTKLLAVFACSLCLIGNLPAENLQDIKKIKRSVYPNYLQTLTLSATSNYSYEDAMNRFERRKPNGYVVESIKYNKYNGQFIVTIKLRKV